MNSNGDQIVKKTDTCSQKILDEYNLIKVEINLMFGEPLTLTMRVVCA